MEMESGGIGRRDVSIYARAYIVVRHRGEG